MRAASLPKEGWNWSPPETPLEAKQKYRKWLSEKRQWFVYDMCRGARRNAFYSLGSGLHSIMDSTSPSHEGFQKWAGLFSFGAPAHGVGDQFISRDRELAAIKKMRAYWKVAMDELMDQCPESYPNYNLKSYAAEFRTLTKSDYLAGSEYHRWDQFADEP